jgi:hypothetical protein
MNTENIKTVFEEYLKTEQTQYAILLNGSWGSGKTFFWKNELAKVVEKCGFKVIYISLNGVSKVEVLERLLFLKLVPFLDNQENKVLKTLTTLVTNATNAVSKAVFKTSIDDIVKGVSVDVFNFSQYVICFDDLERCQIPMKEILGFINGYVEHKYLKAVIFSDESNIDSSQKNYDNIKEKVVGRILNFELNQSDTIPLLFEKYRIHAEFFKFLESKKDFFISLMQEYKQNNLRTITAYLEVVYKLFPSFTNQKDDYVNEVLLFAAIILLEFKKGKLKSSDSKDSKGLEQINSQYNSLNFARAIDRTMNGASAEPQEKSYSDLFHENYLNKRADDYHFYPSVYEYVLSGYLDSSKLVSEFSARYPEVVTKENQAFRTLLNYKFRELENDEFDTLANDVLQFAEEGKYVIYDYSQMATFFYYFSENALVNKSELEITKILEKGISIAKQRKEIHDFSMTNLLHFGGGSASVMKIKAMIKDAHDSIKAEQVMHEGDELIDYLLNKDEYALAELFEKYKHSKNFLKFVQHDKVLDAVLNASNKILFNLAEILKDRYKSMNIGEFLYDDVVFLDAIKKGINSHLAANASIIGMNRYSLNSLASALSDAQNHLEATRR